MSAAQDNIAFALVDRSLETLAEVVCRGHRHSTRRDALEQAVIARGELTLAELHHYRRWLEDSYARGLLRQSEHEMLQAWLTALVQRAVAPSTSAAELHDRVVPVR